MSQEQLPIEPLHLLPLLCSPEHPAADSGRTFDLSTPEHCSPVAFAELPLYIPGMTTPVVGFDGGINLAALDPHRDNSLLCILRPYLDMAERDFVELFCRDLTTPVAFHTVSEDEAEKGLLIPLYIPRTSLPDGTIEPVFFRVSRIGGGTDETRRFRLKVDTVVPAGRDPVSSTPWHDNLAAPEPELDFVDEAAAGRGVRVTIPFYPVDISQPVNTHRAVRDRIRLSIGAVITEHRVTEGEAAGREPIDIWIYAGTWKEIGSGSHVCEYEIVDEVGNYSLRWSPMGFIEVELDDGAEPLLPECYIFEAPDNILDADQQMGEDATIEVAVHRFDYVVGDLIRVRARGRTVEGIIVDTFYEHPVTVTGRNARIPYPYADFALLVGGRVQLSYERIRSGVPNRPSRSTIVQVIGTPVGIGLPPPRVDEAPDGVLPPESLFVTVRIDAYTGQDPFDLVTLVLEGTYANGTRYYREIDDVAGDGDITFPLMNGANGDIAKLEGGTLRLYYIVTGAAGPRPPSRDLLLDVGQPQASLPEPAVDQAPPPDYVFDHKQSLGDARILVRAHTDIRENDTITLHFEGRAASGSAPPQTFKVLAHWVGRDLPFTVRRAYVLANLNSSARIYYTLARDNERTRFSHAVEMKVGAALELGVPEVLEATKTGPTSAQINPLHVDNPPVFTVRVRYAPMLATDNITVFLVGKPGFVPPYITPQPGDPALGYVDFKTSNSSIAAHLGQILKVGYRVTRQGATTDSDELDLRVQAFNELSPNPLPFPTLNGIASGGRLDLSTFTGNALAAVAKWPLSAAGQRVWMTCSSSGVAPLKVLEGYAITSTEAANGLVNKAVLRSWLQALPDNRQITVTCKVTFDGSTEEAQAVGFPTSNYILTYGALKVPEVLEATNTGPTSAQINPLHVDNPPVFTVRVRYAPMLATDNITAFLVGKPGFTAPVINPQPGNPGQGYVDFKTSSSSIAAHLGQILKVGYRVTRPGATTDSEQLDLRVQAFNELSPNPLPFPIINGIASGGRLDLNTFAGNALAAVAKWPLSATGQRVWMTCSSSGVAPLKVLEGYAITSTEAANGLVNKTVLRSWLQALPDNRQITVTCKVTFDGSTAEAQAVTFKTTTYTIRAAVPTFVFNTSPVTRSQIQYLWKDRPDLRPANGIDQFQYQATGGQPGYTYTSSNTACAVVDSVGRVVIRDNGNTTITARDSGGRQLSYTVTVSNVRFFQDNGQGGGYLECVKIASNRGGRLPNLGELRAVYNAYIGVWKGQAHTYFWSTDSAGFLSRHGKNLSNGGEASLSELGNCLCLVML